MCEAAPLSSFDRCIGHMAADDLKRLLNSDPNLSELANLEIGPETLQILLPHLEGKSGVVISRSTFFSDTNISFESARFSGRWVFQDVRFIDPVDFDGATFLSHVSFSNCYFGDLALFSSTRFERAASFYGTTFCEEVTFGHDKDSQGYDGSFIPAARFEREASFNRTKFLAKADFGGAIFSSEVEFNNAAFEGPVSFERCRFNAGASFNESSVRESISFVGAAIKGDLDLRLSTPSTKIVLDRSILDEPLVIQLASKMSCSGIVFRHPLRINGGAGASILSLTDAILESPVVLSDVSLELCRFEGSTGLEQLRLPRLRGLSHVQRRLMLFEEILVHDRRGRSWARRLVAENDAESDRTAYPAHVEDTYRQLRSALESTRSLPASSDMYYGEMEMRRVRARRGERLLLATYRLTSGYGLRACRSLTTYLTLVALVTLWIYNRPKIFFATEPPMAGGLRLDHINNVAAVVLRGSANLLSPLAEGLTAAGTLLFVVLKLAGPGFFALTILAIRARVQR
jgi:uncharacterized protein YjbI with pentapeptide repeats